MKKEKPKQKRNSRWGRVIANYAIALIVIGIIYFLLTKFLCPMIVK